jgi:hypothetical protein
MVAYDGSDSSQSALRYAGALAQACGKCAVHVVNVMPSAEEIGVDLLGQGGSRSGAGKILEEAVAVANDAGFQISTSSVQGRIFDKISEEADRTGCELIALGRRGMTRLERMLMGSVTARVIGHTSKDVLVVPRGMSFRSDRIALATDGSKYSDAAVEQALWFAKRFKSSITAVMVAETHDQYMVEAPNLLDVIIQQAEKTLAEVARRVEAEGIPIATLVKEGEASRSILDVADQAGADIIFMGSHGRRGLTRLLMGSITEKVIGQAKVPVFVKRM